MKLDTFFQKFELFADAPDAVAKMRELVLGLAVQGRLVEQDPREGSGAALLDIAVTERIRLIREKILKKPRVIQPVAEFECPKLPTNWVLTSLNEITQIAPRNSANDSTMATFLPMSAIPQRYGGALTGQSRSWSDIKKGFTHLANSDIALAKITPCFQNGKSAVIDDLENEIGAGTTELHVARPFAPVVNPHYVWIFLKSPRFLLEGVPHMTGSAGQKRVPIGYFALKPFPLPPLAEQKRIVAKVDALMALCDRLESEQRERETRHAALARASLARFGDAPTPANLQFLFHKSYDIAPADLRKSILTLAVQGKLVPQDPEDEPAETLLDRIKTEQNKMLNKNYPNQNEASTQLRKRCSRTLPNGLDTLVDGWVWTTLIQSTLLVVDCHNKTAPYTERGIRLLRTTNIRDGQLNLSAPKFVSEATYEKWSSRCRPEPGDILITREAPMGEVCIIPEGMQVCMGQRMMLIRVVPGTIDQKFLLYSLMDPSLMERVQDKPVGATVKHLRVGGVETLLIPLPPLSEQRRIVAKVDELMALVDALETQLAAARSTAGNLLEALVAELSANGASSTKRSPGR